MASRMISWVKVLLFPTCRENLTLPRRPSARVISRGFSSVVTGFLERNEGRDSLSLVDPGSQIPIQPPTQQALTSPE